MKILCWLITGNVQEVGRERDDTGVGAKKDTEVGVEIDTNANTKTARKIPSMRRIHCI